MSNSKDHRFLDELLTCYNFGFEGMRAKRFYAGKPFVDEVVASIVKVILSKKTKTHDNKWRVSEIAKILMNHDLKGSEFEKKIEDDDLLVEELFARTRLLYMGLVE